MSGSHCVAMAHLFVEQRYDVNLKRFSNRSVVERAVGLTVGDGCFEFGPWDALEIARAEQAVWNDERIFYRSYSYAERERIC